MYMRRKTRTHRKTLIALAVGLALGTVPGLHAQAAPGDDGSTRDSDRYEFKRDWNDLRSQRPELRPDIVHDRAELRQDRAEIRGDRQELARDVRERNQDWHELGVAMKSGDQTAVARERSEIAAGNAEIHSDRVALAGDYAELRKDHAELRSDRADLRGDFAGLRDDGRSFHRDRGASGFERGDRRPDFRTARADRGASLEPRTVHTSLRDVKSARGDLREVHGVHTDARAEANAARNGEVSPRSTHRERLDRVSGQQPHGIHAAADASASKDAAKVAVRAVTK